MKDMHKTIEELLNRGEELIENLNENKKEDEEMNRGILFLQNEYKTNKYYFNPEGHPTIDDVVKVVFEFAWSAHRNYKIED